MGRELLAKEAIEANRPLEERCRPLFFSEYLLDVSHLRVTSCQSTVGHPTGPSTAFLENTISSSVSAVNDHLIFSAA